MSSKISRQTISEMAGKYPAYTVIGLLVGVLLIDYFGVMQFQLSTLMSLNPQISKLSREVEVAKNNIQRMPQYRNELRALEEKIVHLNLKIKLREEIPLVLENISRMSNPNNVNIDRVMPDTSLEDPVLKNKEGQYFSVPVSVEASSGYHDFGRFLYQLEMEGVFWDILDFTIAANSSDSMKHIIKLNLNTIIFDADEK